MFLVLFAIFFQSSINKTYSSTPYWFWVSWLNRYILDPVNHCWAFFYREYLSNLQIVTCLRIVRKILTIANGMLQLKKNLIIDKCISLFSLKSIVSMYFIILPVQFLTFFIALRDAKRLTLWIGWSGTECFGGALNLISLNPRNLSSWKKLSWKQ